MNKSKYSTSSKKSLFINSPRRFNYAYDNHNVLSPSNKSTISHQTTYNDYIETSINVMDLQLNFDLLKLKIDKMNRMANKIFNEESSVKTFNIHSNKYHDYFSSKKKPNYFEENSCSPPRREIKTKEKNEIKNIEQFSILKRELDLNCELNLKENSIKSNNEVFDSNSIPQNDISNSRKNSDFNLFFDEDIDALTKEILDIKTQNEYDFANTKRALTFLSEDSFRRNERRIKTEKQFSFKNLLSFEEDEIFTNGENLTCKNGDTYTITPNKRRLKLTKDISMTPAELINLLSTKNINFYKNRIETQSTEHTEKSIQIDTKNLNFSMGDFENKINVSTLEINEFGLEEVTNKRSKSNNSQRNHIIQKKHSLCKKFKKNPLKFYTKIPCEEYLKSLKINTGTLFNHSKEASNLKHKLFKHNCK